MSKKKREFWESRVLNQVSQVYYYNRLIDIAISRYNWINLPETCDERFLELSLVTSGGGLFVNDDVMGAVYSLRFMPSGDFDMYGNTVRRIGWGYNNTQIYCSPVDSVIVYNNTLKRGIMSDLEYYAIRLANIDRTVDVNVSAQKTPVLILCDENERLSMVNLYEQYTGNYPVIFGNKRLNPEAIKSINTNAPYVGDKLNELKNKIWNEALTYLGIYNVEYKTGNITIEEVQRSQGGVIASRFGGLLMRQKACDELNKMTGLDVWCEYRDPSDYVQMEGPLGPDKDVGVGNRDRAIEEGGDSDE